MNFLPVRNDEQLQEDLRLFRWNIFGSITMNVLQKCYECSLKDVPKTQELKWSTPTAAFSEGFAILMTADKCLPAT